MSWNTLFFALFLLGTLALPSKKKHTFEIDADVPFFVNKVGPYNNPAEFYPYYSLPFCAPKELNHKHNNLGQNLIGDEAVSALYDIHFGHDIEFQQLCSETFTYEQLDQFRSAIQEYYYFEWLYDDLPIFGFVGSVEDADSFKPRYILYTHTHFSISKNGGHIIQVNVTTDPTLAVDITELEPSKVIEFSYSVKWVDTDLDWQWRYRSYHQKFFKQELQIHWLSILNSIILVLLLTGFLAIIVVRVLKSDYARYDEEDDADFGWKLIHGDVFRFPPHINLLSAWMGLGAQFLAICFGLALLALFGLFHPNMRGNLYTSILAMYALTSGPAGYISASTYKSFGGTNWSWNIVLASVLFTGPFTVVVAVINTIAIYYKVMIAIPFTSILQVTALMIFVGFPLTLVGGIAGRRVSVEFEAPCRTKKIVRPIPPLPWYRQLPAQMAMAGFLPFSAIYIELFYIFSSVWGRNTYQLYGIIFIVFLILLVVTGAITVALTYFRLSLEDHEWWWPAFLSGGSTGVFIYLYAVYFFAYRSRMFGTLQTSFYFGYMALVSYFFFVMLGSVGFLSSLAFVKNIYARLKTD